MRMIKSVTAFMLVFAMIAGSICVTETEAASAEVRLRENSGTLTIRQDGSQITRSKTKIRVKKRDGVKIKKITYQTADPDVVKVSKKGKVTPKAMGATTVTVRVKYRYRKKDKTKKLNYRVRVDKDYRHILSGLTLKYKTYATCVDGAEGINPCYDTTVQMDKEFFAWDCLSMSVSDPSVADIGENGLLVGKKTGTTSVSIKSTDDTGLSVTATLKVFTTRSELEEKNDLYNSVRDGYMAKVESGWTEEEKERFVDEDGAVHWSQASEIKLQTDTNKDAIIKTYSSAPKQPDNTPGDALNSILSTGLAMLNGGDTAEEAFFRILQDKVVAPIREANSIEELVRVSEDLEKRGLPGFLNASGFFKYRENDSYYADVMNGKLPLPSGPTDVSRRYLPSINSSVSQAGHAGASEKEKKFIQNGYKTLFKLLGFGTLSKKELADYVDLLTEYGTMFNNDTSSDERKPLKEVDEEYPYLRIREHLENKGYRISGEDPVEIQHPSANRLLDKYLSQEKNLGIMKLYLAEAATYDLVNYTRASLRIAYEMNPESSDDEASIRESVENDYKRQMEGLEGLVPWDFEHIYTDTVYPKGFKTQFEELVQEYKDAYREAISASGYGETFKVNMLKKLDTLDVECLYPDDATYKKYEIPYDLVTAAEGGNLADNVLKVYRYQADLERMTIGTEVDRMSWWYPDDAVNQNLPGTANAYYNFLVNRCVFFHGGIGKDVLFFYNEQGDEETDVKNISYMATTIGHEMGHAFDTTGSRFDAEGMLVDLWGADDRTLYDNKVKKLAEIYGSLLLHADREENKAYYQNGMNVVGESMADLGGTEIALRILQKKYPGRDDLIQKFFRYTAEQWMTTEQDSIPPYMLDGYINDVHPLSRARTNGVASMMDAFYRVFDVKEGDAMYLAPEDRVELWSAD
ncbi:MAG: Ig-like domain-containing protein [Eubacterium sp.]|nr:Ig-like domain-containing protein [Eubacterium sp.]